MDQNNTSGPGADAAKAMLPARQRWGALIAQQRESGLGVAAFCRGQSIPTSSFYGWRAKLERRKQRPLSAAGRLPAASPRAGGRDANAQFVAVKLAGGRAEGGMTAELEVRLRGGRGVLVRSFSSGTVQLLIETVRALEQLA